MKNRVKELREQKRIPANELMSMVGWNSRGLMSKKENGVVGISVEEAFKLSKIFKTPIEKIFIQ